MSKRKSKPQEKKISDETQIVLWVICFVLGSLLVIDGTIQKNIDQYFVMGSAIVLVSVWFGAKAVLARKNDIRNRKK